MTAGVGDSIKHKIAYTLWYRTKVRAKLRKIKFSLTKKFVEDAINQGVCAVTGIAFNIDPARKKYSAFAASIDRIDPDKGYVKSNCQVVCWIYNRAKGNGTHTDVLTLMEALMPSSSKKQADFMRAIAHSPKFAKKAGVPQSVGKDFATADKGKKFKQGGEMAVKKFDPKKLFKGKESVGEELKEAKAIKSGKITPMQYAKGEKSEPMKKMAEGGLSMSARKSADTQRSSATAKKTPSEMIVDDITKGKSPAIPKELQKPDGKKKGGVIKKMKSGGSCYKEGGFVRAADGCATKGKTKGRFI